MNKEILISQNETLEGRERRIKKPSQRDQQLLGGKNTQQHFPCAPDESFVLTRNEKSGAKT